MKLTEIKEILLNENSKFNKETRYIRGYFNLIESCLKLDRKYYESKQRKNPNYKYYERHHILPKSLFPQYKDFNKQFKWNKVLLTAKEHILAHILLMKHYKEINYKNGLYKTSWGFIATVGDNFKYKKYCNNMELGGKVTAKNIITGEVVKVDIDDFKNNDNLVGHTKGTLPVLNLLTNKIIVVTMEEFSSDDNLVSFNIDKVVVKDIRDNKIKQVSKNDFEKYSYYVGVNIGMVVAKNILTNEKVRVTKEEFDNNPNLVGVNIGKKRTTEWKENHSKRMSGENHPSTKLIHIYNEKGELMFICKISFIKFCKKYNLPFGVLKESFKNDGEPIYQSDGSFKIAKHNGNDKYKGWYAKIID